MLRCLVVWCVMQLVWFSAGCAKPLFLQGKSFTWAKKTLASLSTREKIAQLFMIAAISDQDQREFLASTLKKFYPYNLRADQLEKMIQEYQVGGVIFLGKSAPTAQLALTNRYQSISKLPLLVGQDNEWGLSLRLHSTIRFPKNMALAAMADRSLLYQAGYEVGLQCKVLGVHINFAPVVDVNNNPRNPIIHERSFGDSPSAVARNAALWMQGLQDAGVLACAKHFPGHGDTAVDSHDVLPIISHALERLHAVELYPFTSLIHQGVDAVMIAHLAVPALEKKEQQPATFSRAIVHDLLQKELGFEGLVITDALGMEALTKYFKPGQIEYEAYAAGNDVLLCPLDVSQAIDRIEKAINDGAFSLADLDRRVFKVLAAKESLGLHKNRLLASTDVEDFLQRPAATELQKKLYESAITLVMNDGIIPLSKENVATAAVVIVGANGDAVFAREFAKEWRLPVFAYDAELSADKIKKQCNEIALYKTVIIAFIDGPRSVPGCDGMSGVIDLLRQSAEQGKKIIVVLCSSPYKLRCLDPYKNYINALLVAYEQEPAAQQSAAHVIMGIASAQGRLPITMPG